MSFNDPNDPRNPQKQNQKQKPVAVDANGRPIAQQVDPQSNSSGPGRRNPNDPNGPYVDPHGPYASNPADEPRTKDDPRGPKLPEPPLRSRRTEPSAENTSPNRLNEYGPDHDPSTDDR